MTRNRRRQRLAIESLEDRRVPATWGIPWADAQHITASFVPDGTSVPGATSNLDQALNSQLGANNWEATILKALQTWAANSNINIGVVPDGGQPLGVAGPAQGDARFGDVRIAAEPLPADVVAITAPYSPGGGTLSGDIILNSNDDFNPADPGSYDLFTVALHEAGHVFGFADSSSPSSFMYNVYQGPQAGLASGAVPALQALYGGARNIASLDNIQSSTNPASPVNIPNPPGNGTSATVPGDLASAQASNYFTLQAPNLTSIPLGVDLGVQTAGLSLLTPKVTVFNPLGQVVATASASGPLDGGASVHLGGLIQGQKYTVQVQGATGDVFSVGSYSLTVSATLPSSGPSSPTAGSHPLQEPGNYNGSTPLTVGDSILGSNQVDVYSLKTPAATPNGLTVNVQDWGVGLAAPSVTVYDALGNVVGSATAPNAATTSVTVHAAVVLPGATYYLRVVSGTINPGGFGTYQASASFAAPTSTTAFVPATPWLGSNGGGSGQANSTLQGAWNLQAPAGVASQSSYQAIDGVSPSQPQDFFRLNAAHAKNVPIEVMTVSVQALGNSGLLPAITVFDQNGNPLNAQVLEEQQGVTVIQVSLANPGGQYEVEVSSAPSGGAAVAGNYVLDATFGSSLAPIGPIASGTLAASPAGSPTPSASSTLTIGQGEIYSFVLAGSAAGTGTDAVLQATLTDASGNVVATLSTPAGQAQSLITLLPTGTYTILIGEYSPSGQPIPQLAYSLSGTNLTDPIKPYAGTGSGGATGTK